MLGLQLSLVRFRGHIKQHSKSLLAHIFLKFREAQGLLAGRCVDELCLRRSIVRGLFFLVVICGNFFERGHVALYPQTRDLAVAIMQICCTGASFRLIDSFFRHCIIRICYASRNGLVREHPHTSEESQR